MPAVADETRLRAANGRIESARYLGYTLGPLLGGALAAGGGTRVALLIDAASFAVVALAALVAAPARARPRATAPPSAAPATASSSCSATACSRGHLVAFVSLLFMTASATAEVFFATDVLARAISATACS